MDEKSYMKKKSHFYLLLLLLSYHKQEYLSNYGFNEICSSKVCRGAGRNPLYSFLKLIILIKSIYTEMFLINSGTSLAKKI